MLKNTAKDGREQLMCAQIGRPKKVRYIQKMPQTTLFSPRGRPGRPEEVEIPLDLLETLKLADLQGFSQEEGARAMRISRPSFGRILRAARAKIADALVNGKAIRIIAGDGQLGVHRLDLNHATFNDALNKFEERHNQVLKNIAAQSFASRRKETDIKEANPAATENEQSARESAANPAAETHP